MASERRGARRPGRRGRAAALLALGAGLALTALGSTIAYQRAERQAQRDFDERAALLGKSVERSIALPVESVRAISSFRRISTRTTPDDFSSFAGALMAAHPSLAALEWAEFIDEAGRARFEAEMSQQLGHPFAVREPGEGRMRAAPGRPRYVVLTRLHPFLGDLEGLDVSFEPVRRAAIERTVERGRPTATARFQLVEDPPGVYSVGVYDPVLSEDQRSPRGLGIGLFRLDPLIRQALAGVDFNELDFQLVDEDAAPEDRLLFESRPGLAGQLTGRHTRAQSFEFADRRWTATFAPRASVEHASIWWIAAVASVASLLASIIAAQLHARRRLEAELSAERELGGYLLTRPLGEGGMGSVYEARHRVLRRTVAIKLIRPEQLTAGLTERFVREARTLSELSHPNTVTLYDYGTAQDGRLYLVMERVDGITLAKLIERHGAQPPGRVRRLLVQVCEALAEAHDKGVIHRDLKPENLMLCERGGLHDFVKVLDFGLAKRVRQGDARLSTPGTVVGTFSYLAPECLSNPDSASPRSDIYALGCVAHELLVGDELFPDRDSISLIAAHLSQPAPIIDDEAVGPEMARVIGRCLEKDPDARYQSMRQLALALSRLDLPPWTEVDAAEWWEAHGPVRPGDEPDLGSLPEPITLRPVPAPQPGPR